MIANIGRILDGFDCHNPGRIIDLRKFSLSDTFSFLVNGLFVILQAARFIDFNTIGIFIGEGTYVMSPFSILFLSGSSITHFDKIA